MLRLLLDVFVLAIVPLLMAAYGGHLAAEAIPDEKVKRKAKCIFWGLAAAGLILVTYQQILYRSDEHSRSESFRRQIDNLTSLILHPPSSPDVQAAVRAMHDAIEKLHPSTPKVTAAQPAMPPVQKSPPSQYASISNAQLKEQALDLAKAMRGYEANFRKQETELLTEQPPRDAASQELNDFYDKRTNLYLKFRIGTETEFRNTVLGEAISLRDEMLKRLNETMNQREEETLIAFKGILAGPTPIADAADYLERLARRLS